MLEYFLALRKTVTVILMSIHYIFDYDGSWRFSVAACNRHQLVPDKPAVGRVHVYWHIAYLRDGRAHWIGNF